MIRSTLINGVKCWPCARCKALKPREAFNWVIRYMDGLDMPKRHSWCKACLSTYNARRPTTRAGRRGFSRASAPAAKCGTAAPGCDVLVSPEGNAAGAVGAGVAA